MPSKRIADVKPGDLIDLEGDRFADPTGDRVEFQSEYGLVTESERETASCVRLHVEGVDSFGFPPDHRVKFAGRLPGWED